MDRNYEYVVKSGIHRNLSEIVFHLEEPRVGQSYPNFCAARLASKFTKVCLSGAGGDELFAGYPWRYRHFETETSNQFKDRYFSSWQRLTTKEQRKLLFPNVNHFEYEERLKSVFFDKFGAAKKLGRSWADDVNACLYFEAKTFMHGLLVVEDKLSMAHGLETRLPFLDNDLVDFALKCPPKLKLTNLPIASFADENNLLAKKKLGEMQGKVLLRKAMKKILPENVTNLKKQGFSAPDATWFKKYVKSEVYSNLWLEDNFLYEFLNFDQVKKIIESHLNGKQNKRLFIWSVLYCWEWFNSYREKLER